MGKIRTRIIGLEDVEKEQKKEQKKKAEEKKLKAVKSEEVVESKENQKEEPKAKAKASEGKKTRAQKQTKARVRGRNYRSAKDQLKKDKVYPLPEAIAVLRKVKYAKFDESVELHINTTEEGMRGEISLPHSTGKTVRVAIVDDALIDRLGENKIDFDVLISHPSFMPKLARFAKVLGPKGLMPNPKTGTISPKPEEVAKKFQSGLLKWKGEAKFPLIHMMIGKLSADDKAIEENVRAFMTAIGDTKVKAAFIKTTMSPALQISL